MNVQIFGTKKNPDTRKAERFFKERRIPFQSVDLQEKSLSKGELRSVIQAVGGIALLIDPASSDEDTRLLLPYLQPEDQLIKLTEHPALLRQPIVRNGRFATVGYCPDVWKSWK